MRIIASYIMRGRMQATLVVAVAAMATLIFPPLSYLSGAALGLVTLRHGAKEGLLVVAMAAAAAALLGQLVLGSPMAAVAFSAVLWLPMVLLGAVLRHTVSLPTTLVVATLLGGLVVIAIYVALGEPAVWWREQLTIIFQALLEEAQTPTEVEAAITGLSKLMTGLLASGLMITLVLNLLLARWWQALLYNVGGFQQEFHSLRLDPRLAWVAFALMVATLFSSADGGLSTDLAMLVLSLYLLQGIAVAHGAVGILGASNVWLVGMYAMLAFLPHAVLVVAAIGVTDTWFNFRARCKPGKGSGGE